MIRAVKRVLLCGLIPLLLFPASAVATPTKHRHRRVAKAVPGVLTATPFVFPFIPPAPVTPGAQQLTLTIFGSNLSTGTTVVVFSTGEGTFGGGTSEFFLTLGGSSTNGGSATTGASSTSSTGSAVSTSLVGRTDDYGAAALIATRGFTTRLLERGRIPQVTLNHSPPPRLEKDNFWSCFISYSSKDEAIVWKLWTDLRRNGVKCWFAPEDLQIGDPIRRGIDQRIGQFDKVLLILSENSITSQWVEEEVEAAFEEERRRDIIKLFPIRIDRAVMGCKEGWPAYVRRTRNIGDLTRWTERTAYEQALTRILQDLKKT